MATHRCGVLGLGLRAQASASDLQALWAQGQQAIARLAERPPVCAVAVLAAKIDHPALAAWLADALAPAVLMGVPPGQLPAQPVSTRSPRMLARYGTGSVAEATALAAAGPGAALVLPRLVAGDGSATLAMALRRAGPLNCCLAAAVPLH